MVTQGGEALHLERANVPMACIAGAEFGQRVELLRQREGPAL